MPADRFLDTSVVVRYLTADPLELFQRAQAIIDGPSTLTLTDVVLTEVLYVLTSVYRVPRDVVVDRLIEFVSKENISTFALDKDTVVHGILMCRGSSRVSISDAMIWAAARAAGATTVYTFDGRFPSEGVVLRSTP